MNTINRDTQKFAFKASSITVDGIDRDVYKSPITDTVKKSKKGILDLVFRDGSYQTVNGTQSDTVMRTVYENGCILIEDDFNTIISRSRI